MTEIIRPETINFENGVKDKPTFSAIEMANRNAKLRAHLASNDIDAAIFSSIHNINYYADFVYCSFGRPYALVVTQDAHTTVTANIDGGQPWRQSYEDNIVYTDWKKDNYFRALKKLLPTQKRVGIEFDHMTLERRQKLEEFLPGVEFVDIGVATMKMRMIKSAEEIALIKQGARICDIGGSACVEAIAEGAPEYEVALHATQAMVRAIAKTYPHTELMDTWTWFQSGINTDGAHNPVTSRRVEKGDILSLNCFSMVSGYYQALERTLFFHSATKRELELWEVNCEVHRKGLTLIKPGAVCSEIAAELNEIFLSHDLLDYRTFGYGHSFGTLSHYYGREAGLELREDIDTVLEPGMVVSIEPMITIPEGMDGAGGYREHDILVVEENGAENITKFPFGPEHNIIR
ncbi:M24 family metallopeptidase [Leucothrix pacifica]|uniref:M24 family metallopeptidase n=1 Tax=Leucothrix pacifica TaxID=1247513 RepID=UPI001C6416C8|nr:M24 family metallopeptidase [Leucothrix pacifica]